MLKQKVRCYATVKGIVLRLKQSIQDVVITDDYTHLKVVEVIVQQDCSIGDAFLGSHKYKWHHSL